MKKFYLEVTYFDENDTRIFKLDAINEKDAGKKLKQCTDIFGLGWSDETMEIGHISDNLSEFIEDAK